MTDAPKRQNLTAIGGSLLDNGYLVDFGTGDMATLVIDKALVNKDVLAEVIRVKLVC